MELWFHGYCTNITIDCKLHLVFSLLWEVFHVFEVIKTCFVVVFICKKMSVYDTPLIKIPDPLKFNSNNLLNTSSKSSIYAYPG